MEKYKLVFKKSVAKDLRDISKRDVAGILNSDFRAALSVTPI
jgi:hypothetical protein